MNNRIRALALVAMGTGALITALVFAWGIRRYGSAEDFRLRLYSEVEARRPHPLYAPTPLAQEALASIAIAGADIAESPAELPEKLIPSQASTAMPVADSPQTSAALFLPVESELRRAPGPRAARAVESPRPPNPRASSCLPACRSVGCATIGRPGTTAALQPSP